MFNKIFEKTIHGLSFGIGMGISFRILPKIDYNKKEDNKNFINR